MLIAKKRTVIPACDVDKDKFITILEATALELTSQLTAIFK